LLVTNKSSVYIYIYKDVELLIGRIGNVSAKSHAKKVKKQISLKTYPN